MKLLLVTGICLCGAISGWANTITATAGNLGKNQDVVNNGVIPHAWNYTPPKAGSGITWIAGVDTEDDMNNPNPPVSTFNPYFVGGQPEQLQGFAPQNPLTFKGSLGSQAINKGVGQSQVTPNQGSDNHTNYSATWTATATGSLGTAKTVGNVTQNPNWHSTTQGNDPWYLNPSDFLPTTGTYNLFFMSEVDSVNLSPVGSFDYDVNYQTATGTVDLLNISGGDGSLTVTLNPFPGLSVYQLTSQNEGAADITSPPLTAGQIQGLFQSVANAGQLFSPVTFGFVIDNLPIPTQDMGGGAVAAMNVNTTVVDSQTGNGSQATPEPAAFLLIVPGLVVLSVLRRHRKFARSPAYEREN
jgi:hypothetical protein